MQFPNLLLAGQLRCQFLLIQGFLRGEKIDSNARSGQSLKRRFKFLLFISSRTHIAVELLIQRNDQLIGLRQLEAFVVGRVAAGDRGHLSDDFFPNGLNVLSVDL